MSGAPDEDDIEELRRQKLEELQERQEGGGGGDHEEAMRAQQEQADAQKQAALRQHLTDGARKRLNSVRMSKPEFADQVEQQVLALARSGRLGDRITEDQMKELLSELTPDSKRFDITHR
jgi:programmed cell death protein 5